MRLRLSWANVPTNHNDKLPIDTIYIYIQADNTGCFKKNTPLWFLEFFSFRGSYDKS